MYNDTITAPEAAKLLGITERALSDYARKGWLKPLAGEGAYKALRYRKEDILVIKELRYRKFEVPEMVAMAVQAHANVRRLERLVEQLMLVVGADIPTRDLSVDALTALHVKAQDAQGPWSAQDAFEWGRVFMSIGEEYFELVTYHLHDEEPWLPYLELGTSILKSHLRTMIKADSETRAALQYLDMARRHLREVAFFHVRSAHGRRYAYELFPDVKDGAHAELASLANTLFC